MGIWVGGPPQSADVVETFWKKTAIDQGLFINELQDEITRLRRAMPADALREYDRRKSVEH